MTATLASSFTTSPFARLEAEGRLLNPVHKGATKKPGRFAFRGDVALEFAPKLADEARPPKTKVDQVLAVSNAGSETIDFFAAYLLSFAYLNLVGDVLGDLLKPGGKYFLFCSNINLTEHYTVTYKGITFFVLPLDEAGVFNELLDLIHLDRGDVKRLDGAGKLDAIADHVAAFTATYPAISYEEGLARMNPVRNPNENRPV